MMRPLRDHNREAPSRLPITPWQPRGRAGVRRRALPRGGEPTEVTPLSGARWLPKASQIRSGASYSAFARKAGSRLELPSKNSRDAFRAYLDLLLGALIPAIPEMHWPAGASR